MGRQDDGTVVMVGDLCRQELVLLEKFRQARFLSASGHRVALTVMFYAGQRDCDMTIEDRERVAPEAGRQPGMRP